MTDEKILTIQEKIQAQKEKVQIRVKNSNISQKNEEKIVETPKKEVIQNPVNRKEEKQNDIADRYYSTPVAKRYCDNDNDYDYSHHGGSASTILGGIFIMVIGFSVLTLGNYIVTSISGSLAMSTNDPTLINNTGQVISYVGTISPLFGLAGMVLGFSMILFSLRCAIR